MTRAGGARALALAGAIAVMASLLPLGAAAQAPDTSFRAGAAEVDITPPAWTAASDADFVPACGPDAATVESLWPGPRQYRFEEPYIDTRGLGRYALGDPFCDADGNGHYDAPYLAGGSGSGRWPESNDASVPVSAEAVVLASGAHRIALVTVDSIGLFNTEMDAIRARARVLAPAVGQVFISSTHDESAPDPIGLWGPSGSDLPVDPGLPASATSGVDAFYMSWMEDRVAQVIARASAGARPAALRLADGQMASNLQSCWSSYPYTDVQLDHVMQGVDSRGAVIFTLVNHSTHVETLAFSGQRYYVDQLSADWPGVMRNELRRAYPGSVALEMTGLVGSVETPSVYTPESTQVVNVPAQQRHDVPNPDGCGSVYPNPASGTPVTQVIPFIQAYGLSVAHNAERLLAGPAVERAVPRHVGGTDSPICVQMENNFFAAAFAAGLFGDRPGYADPTCTVGVSMAGTAGSPNLLAPGTPRPPSALWLRTDVALVDVGPAQLAYSPGEVFPFTEIRGPIDRAHLPFPTDSYNPQTDDYSGGKPLPMTPWVSALMTGRHRFLAGLGQDMIGYLFPPGNFVGETGETAEAPWSEYHVNHSNSHDRFGFGHSDDAEALGPYSGLAVATALAAMLPANPAIVPGLYVDAAGRTSTAPFASAGFGGATGVEVLRGGRRQVLTVGREASGWMTYDGLPDPGTAGAGLPYSVSSGGVFLAGGAPLYVDVYAGSEQLR